MSTTVDKGSERPDDLLPPAPKGKRERKVPTFLEQRREPTFLEAMDEPSLFGRWFIPSWSWDRWRTFAKVLFGLPLTEAEGPFFQQCTGRQGPPPTTAMREAWVVVGRRGGKSLIAAAVGAIMGSKDWTASLKPGERGVVMVIAADKDQAQVVLGYLKSFFEEVPQFRKLVAEKGFARDGIRLTNRVTIKVQVASFRRIRGRTVVCAVLDEVAFWYNDETSVNPDTEILKALRPSMLTVPGSLLVAISSPYAKRGVLWDAYRKYWGKDDPRMLVWKASTETMNPSADTEEIQRAYEDDPGSARAEYGAEFREDLESYVSPEALDRVTVKGRSSLPWLPSVRHYAFVDVAGGSGQDSMALAVARVELGKIVIVRLHEWTPPFSPEIAVREAAGILAEYNLKTIVGDQYAKDWPVERFFAHGVTYKPADMVRTDLYDAFLPMVNSGKIELLDQPKSLRQLGALERTTAKSGRAIIGHPPRGHDDLANVIAGACVGLGLTKPSGVVVATVLQSTDGTMRETGVGAPTMGEQQQRQDRDRRRDVWAHPHERGEALETEADVRMGSQKADRWRRAWGGGV